jgi:hypothetical protein
MVVQPRGLHFVIKLSKQNKLLQNSIAKWISIDTRKNALVKYVSPEQNIIIYEPIGLTISKKN